MAKWYAFQQDREDNDWGDGTYSWDEAVAWLEEQHADGNDEAIVATIEEGDEPVCVDETKWEDL